MRRSYLAVTAVVCVAMVSGCAMFRESISDADPEKAKSITGEFDQKDLLKLSQQASEMLLVDFPAAGEKPVVVEMGIDNATKMHLDTKTIADTIVTKMMDSKKMSFVDSSRRDAMLREKGYQLANCSVETRARIGREIGAKYMLTGRIAEISNESGKQVRVSKQEDIYYQLTVEIIDVETGIIAVRKQPDRMRSTSKPLIGY